MKPSLPRRLDEFVEQILNFLIIGSVGAIQHLADFFADGAGHRTGRLPGARARMASRRASMDRFGNRIRRWP